MAAERDDAITLAPSADAAITEAMPTPPEAPLMNTVSPALSSPLLTSASWAVMNTLGNAAASAHDTSGGTGISASGAATTYWA
ncbi:hypothetical protein D3C81_1826510 [compost metagenome]